MLNDANMQTPGAGCKSSCILGLLMRVQGVLPAMYAFALKQGSVKDMTEWPMT